MAKLIGLGLENFRVFSEYTEFDFAPITLLTGANNSGKSSLIKALLLLAANTGRRKNLLEELNFSGELTDVHNLGSFELALNNANKDEKNMTFSFFFEDGDEKYQMNLSYKTASILQQLTLFEFDKKTNEYINIFSIILEESEVNKYQYRVDFFAQYLILKAKTPHNEMYDYSSILQETIPPYINNHYFYEDKDDAKNLICFLGTLIKDINTNDKELLHSFLKDLNTLMWSSYSSFGIEKLGTNLDFVLNFNKYYHVKDFAFQEKLLLKNSNYKKIVEGLIEKSLNRRFERAYFFKYFNELDNALKKIENKIYTFIDTFNFEFETAVRANAKRIYTNAPQGTPFNQLLVNFNKMKFIENSKEKNFINKWLKFFEIADNITFIWKESSHTEIKLFRNGKELDLVDLGFGVTQLLPLLMRIVICKTEYLILEEPENSLHPNLQSKLADMLIDASKPVSDGGFGIRFIVETHSEYLIRKLRVLTKKGTINKEDAVIYYFQNPETLQDGEKLVRKIQINHDGFMTDDFGNGFTNEADNLMIELYDLPNRQN